MNGYATWQNERWNFAAVQGREGRIELDMIAGDFDDSGIIDIDDVVLLIDYVFRGGPALNPLERGDFNGDSEVDTEDIIELIAFVFH